MKEFQPDNKNAPSTWAQRETEAVFAALDSSALGLNETQVKLRQEQYGANSLPRASHRHWSRELLANFIHLFALLLWAAAGLAWIVGMPQLTWAIVAVILINGIFSFWQEYQAERAAEALAALLPHQVTVRRDNLERRIYSAEVVPGDILLLAEGDAIPADARLMKAERLRVDISALTGESRPVPRTAEVVATDGRAMASLANLVFAGTNVASGRGEAIVFATGGNTEFGRIAQLTNVQTERASPLQIELHRVTRMVTFLALGCGLTFFLIGSIFAGLSLTTSFIFALGIIVANVPEGLLPTLTLALAMSVRRMAARQALVKRLSAVETLGATTIILTDKTGTLTENEMTVRELWTGGKSYGVGGIGYEPYGTVESLLPNGETDESVLELLRVAALCCDARLLPLDRERKRWQVIGDPTEAAILVAAAKAGLTEATLKKNSRITELPFDSIRKRMTTIQNFDGLPVACVKGAPSEMLPHCTQINFGDKIIPLDTAQQEKFQHAHNAMARRGLRVLAVAKRSINEKREESEEWRSEEIERDLILLGLIGMEDPPRDEVPSALIDCHNAGVKVVMVTGDDGITASAIGREIGLHHNPPHVVTGDKLEQMTDSALSELLTQKDLLFARTTPEHKLRLVMAYQQRGEVVAVTGDGVNDAPALKRADIGVAMGVVGTDVAREAADMILTDDNFASIVAAIEEGRAVYDNIRKFVTYIFASNIPELIPFLAYGLLHIPLPLTVMQILAVDLGTDLLPALALGMEAPEPDVMRRKPRSRHERLLNWPTLLRAYGWLGMIEAVLSLAAFFYTYWMTGWRPGMEMEASGSLYLTATTMTFAGIVACQIGNVFACRSASQSSLKLGWFSNRLLLVGILVEVGLLLLLIYQPTLAQVFGLAPLDWNHWAMLATFPLILFGLEEIRKALRTNNIGA